MKQAMITFVSILFVFISVTFVYVIQTRITRERALNEACDFAVIASVESDNPVAKVQGDLDNILYEKVKEEGTVVAVEPVVVDTDKGLVAVTVKEDFKYPFNVDGQIEVKRVAIQERTEAQFVTVTFFEQDDGESRVKKEYKARVGYPFPVPSFIDKYRVYDMTGTQELMLPAEVSESVAYVLKKR